MIPSHLLYYSILLILAIFSASFIEDGLCEGMLDPQRLAHNQLLIAMIDDGDVWVGKFIYLYMGVLMRFKPALLQGRLEQFTNFFVGSCRIDS